MVDPVVSSRFGKRPLMDIPAMQVSSTSYQPVNSLQDHVPPLKLENLDNDHRRQVPETIQRPYHTAPPAAVDTYYVDPPRQYNGYYPTREYTHYHGPNGEAVRPVPQHFHSPVKFPGVHIPHNVDHAPPPAVIHHPPVHIIQPYNHRTLVPVVPRPQTFDINCELDYGRVAHISVRESHGHFRGIPGYIRQELLRTYARYPFMEVKLRYENGDYHIFANYDKRRPERYRNGRQRHDMPRDRYYEEENDYYDDRDDDEEDTMTDDIQPRPMGAPRGILRERGWNSDR